MNRAPHIAARVFNTPLLIAPGKLDAIIAGLGGRILGADIELPRFAIDGEPVAIASRQGEWKKPGYDVIDGVARIDVFGVLTHRGSVDMNTSAYLQGYQDIARKLEAALADQSVHAILLNIDSPGGEVAGVFDLADRIFQSRAIKPIHAVAADTAASAAYLLGSAAETLAVTPTADVGSIGVVMRHVDLSQALEKEGVKVTHIYAGSHKIDGNPYAALPEAVRADFQRQIDSLYGMFVEAVGRHRGARFDAAAARATEAGIYMGSEAVSLGLSDRIATPDQIIAELARMGRQSTSPRAARATSQQRRNSMADKDMGGQSPTAEFTQADLERARSEGHAAGLAAGREEGAKAERERAAGILGHAEAQGREALANTLVAQGLGVEQAAAILAATPKAPEAKPGGTFAEAMAGLGNPALEGRDSPDAAGDGANPILAVFQGKKAA
jgi:signal peptide peptidase SppA